MHTAASSSLVLTDFSSLTRYADPQAISHSGFYQLIASGLMRDLLRTQKLSELAEALVVVAEHAHALRQMDLLEQVSRILLNAVFPRKYKSIGRYYQALCIQRFGLGDAHRAANLLERVTETAPPRYKIRAMISLAANARNQNDNQTAHFLYCEAGRIASCTGLYEPYTTVLIPRMVAVINSDDGNHRGALRLLEKIFPLTRAISSLQPHVYYDYLNSLAVELCAVARVEEARNVSRIVLASPFAGAYPEWRETYDEIELRGYRASRATVAFHNATPEASSSSAVSEPGKLVRLPLPERTDTATADPAPGSEPARVFSLHEWKTKMVNQSNGDPQDQTPRPTTSKEKQARIKKLGKMSTREKLLRIMKVIGDERVGDDLLLKALIILEELEIDENSGS